VLVKDEGRLPTGSFKARGLVMAVAMAKELGVTRIAMPTNGNAGAALAAYASRAGIETIVLCPDDTPEINVREIAAQGARVYRVNGLIDECGAIVGKGAAEGHWFDFSTLKEPYRIEGKKTMGLELAAQLGWRLPKAIFYPTGGGTGLIGMWKVFAEMRDGGWLPKDVRMPHMVVAQADGCQPIVRAFHAGEEKATPWENPTTHASGLRVPGPLGDRLILRALRESKGDAHAVSEDAIRAATLRLSRASGVDAAPEGGCALAVTEELIAKNRIPRDAHVLVFNTGSGASYRF
jgi:threonine synthase